MHRRHFIKVLGSSTLAWSLWDGPGGCFPARAETAVHGWASPGPELSLDGLAARFPTAQDEARPWVYWFWCNGFVTKEGVTADLEAMQRVGIGGALIFEVSKANGSNGIFFTEGTPPGPLKYMSPEWQEMFGHVCSEAARLGVKININGGAGWCGFGGPSITAELSMQQVTWSETKVSGGRHVDQALAQPPAIDGYYRDIMVLAFPTPAPASDGQPYRLPDLLTLTVVNPPAWDPSKGGPKPVPPLQAAVQALPPEQCVAPDRIVDLSSKMDAQGKLSWDAPAGDWTILRLGHTTTGVMVHPAPEGGDGYETDKLSRHATDVQFEWQMGKLISEVGPLAGTTLVSTHVDSWETGAQNWTPTFREDFQRLRGYAITPWLPVLTGLVVESLEKSQRFLWDFRQTISDLMVENFGARIRELAEKHGMGFSLEPYHELPANDLTFGGQSTEPMSTVWAWGWSPGGGRFDSWTAAIEASSIAHGYGRRIVGQETFTSGQNEKWLGHPGNVKDIGDWSFCFGVNRFQIHRYAMQPWTNPHDAPGMSMGYYGMHYERTQTWWEMSKAWHEYVARCCFLLRQGHIVVDVAYVQPEGSPQASGVPVEKLLANPSAVYPPDRPGYSFDVLTADVVINRMSVRDGRLLLPDGMSYRVLVLTAVQAITPQLLQKVKELVADGATVIFDEKPEISTSLEDYPQCDEVVKRLASELWDGGKVHQGAHPADVLAGKGVPPDFQSSVPLNYVHRQTGDADIYFVANREAYPVAAECDFRVTGSRPEFWNPLRGAMEPAVMFTIGSDTTRVPVSLEPHGSIFVIFRRGARGPDPVVRVEKDGAEIVPGAWQPRPPEIAVQKAVYFAQKHADQAVDVTAAVSGMASQQRWSFPVAEVVPANAPASPDGIAANILEVQYTSGGRPFKTQALHGREFAFAGTFAEPVPMVAFTTAAGGKPSALIGQPGHYVVSRASGASQVIDAPALEPMPVNGPWQVAFPAGWGAPASITLDQLISWPDHPDPGVQHFSGTATYRTSFELPAAPGPEARAYLDLGEVAVMARLRLNGHDLGILWKSPFVVDITSALVKGANQLTIDVVNLWINRMIGDESLPEDTRRLPDGLIAEWPKWLLENQPRPSGRFTFTTWRLWSKDDPLVPSGLIGPVRILSVHAAPLV
jgi:hypothetical protein